MKHATKLRLIGFALCGAAGVAFGVSGTQLTLSALPGVLLLLFAGGTIGRAGTEPKP